MKKKTLSIMIILVSIAITSIYVGKTYSRYVSKSSATGTVSVAKWSMKIGDTDITPDGTTTTSAISLSPSNIEDVASNKIAPGVNAIGIITLDPSGTEVSFSYSISLDEENINKLPDNVTIKYDYCIGDSSTCETNSNESWNNLGTTTFT